MAHKPILAIINSGQSSSFKFTRWTWYIIIICAKNKHLGEISLEEKGVCFPSDENSKHTYMKIHIFTCMNSKILGKIKWLLYHDKQEIF